MNGWFPVDNSLGSLSYQPYEKILLSIALALITTFALAQNTHFKFMGIELDGSITDFQSKLYAKGFKNTELPYDKKNGARIYDGTFMGFD